MVSDPAKNIPEPSRNITKFLFRTFLNGLLVRPTIHRIIVKHIKSTPSIIVQTNKIMNLDLADNVVIGDPTRPSWGTVRICFKETSG